MPRVALKPFSLLYPLPLALISCANAQGEVSVFTASWLGVASTTPPFLTLGVRPYRWSYQAIKETGEFVVNLPTRELLEAVDICGHAAGSREERIKKAGLALIQASQVKAPLVAQCPVNLECRVKEELTLDSHRLFVAQIVAVQVDQDVLGPEGLIDYARLRPIVYIGNEYWSVGEFLGTSGFSLSHPR